MGGPGRVRPGQFISSKHQLSVGCCQLSAAQCVTSAMCTPDRLVSRLFSTVTFTAVQIAVWQSVTAFAVLCTAVCVPHRRQRGLILRAAEHCRTCCRPK